MLAFTSSNGWEFAPIIRLHPPPPTDQVSPYEQDDTTNLLLLPAVLRRRDPDDSLPLKTFVFLFSIVVPARRAGLHPLPPPFVRWLRLLGFASSRLSWGALPRIPELHSILGGTFASNLGELQNITPLFSNLPRCAAKVACITAEIHSLACISRCSDSSLLSIRIMAFDEYRH
jgi:hypothetical protein